MDHLKNMQNGHGRYTEIVEEEFLPAVTKTKFVVVHFYHNDFERCKIMDMHLDKICKQHTETKFVKINSEKCPFFVAKLQIQTLPTVICFMDGVAFDRIVGFDELGGVDEFPTLLLTRKLVKTGCIKAISK
jgi:thioredoxin-like negative regulator of GroEL